MDFDFYKLVENDDKMVAVICRVPVVDRLCPTLVCVDLVLELPVQRPLAFLTPSAGSTSMRRQHHQAQDKMRGATALTPAALVHRLVSVWTLTTAWAVLVAAVATSSILGALPKTNTLTSGTDRLGAVTP
jgi:hypothetical protein